MVSPPIGGKNTFIDEMMVDEMVGR